MSDQTAAGNDRNKSTVAMTSVGKNGKRKSGAAANKARCAAAPYFAISFCTLSKTA